MIDDQQFEQQYRKKTQERKITEEINEETFSVILAKLIYIFVLMHIKASWESEGLR